MNIPESLLPQFAIVPTVMIPLTLLSVGLSIVATFIAGLFGIQLKAEGPKRLLEVLIKPRILLGALVMNLVIFGVVRAWHYTANMPAFLWRIKMQNADNALPTTRSYEDHREISNIRPQQAAAGAFSLQQAWKQGLPEGAFRDPILSGSSLFVGNDDGSVYELEQDSGQILRRFFIGTPVSPSPAVYQAALFVGEGQHETHHARLYKFDLASGSLLAAFKTKGHIEASPIIVDSPDGSVLLLSAGADGLYALDPQTMKRRWHQKDGHIDAEVQVANGTVFVGSGREKDDVQALRPYALAYELQTGTLLWKRELPASSWMRPVLVGDDVCFSSGELYYESELGALHCFRQSSGEPSVTINVQAPITSVPLAVDSTVYVVDIKSRVCALDTRSARSLWCRELPPAKFSYSSAIYDAGHLVIAHKTEGIFALDPLSGEVILQHKPENWGKTYGAIATNGKRWFVADGEGLVQAFDLHLEAAKNLGVEP